MKKLAIGRVEQFVNKELLHCLERDLQNLLMIKESDLECCLYFHLRRFLESDEKWKVFARKHVKPSGARIAEKKRRYIDFIVFHGEDPKLAFELKWNAQKLGEKDLSSLGACIDDLHVHKAYFITTRYRRRNYERLPLESRKRYHLLEKPIDLQGDEDFKKEWQEKRQYFTRRMRPRLRVRDKQELRSRAAAAGS
jgi:hypothetical protein